MDVTNRCFGIFSSSTYQTILVEKKGSQKYAVMKLRMVGSRLKRNGMLAETNFLVHLLKGVEGKKICQKIDILVHVLKGINRKSKTQKVD